STPTCCLDSTLRARSYLFEHGAAFEVRSPGAIAIGKRTSWVVVGPGIQVIANMHVTQIEPLVAAG
ncbi:MAG TPA: hypothetical protein VEQ85_03330, partial [Lacipirellulaceae bacterium]|nr:hypothetical protein [Lacipirellulaceae bacterium]